MDGQVEVDAASFQINSEEQWTLDVPSAHMYRLSPRVFREYLGKKETQVLDFLFFEKLDIYDLQGILQPEGPFFGRGRVEFGTPPLNQGDETKIFIPVHGVIEVELQGDQLAFLSSEQVYSECKLLRYQFAQESLSTLCFDGRCDLHVHVQPYQVLSTLSARFPVILTGTVDHPEVLFPKNQEIPSWLRKKLGWK